MIMDGRATNERCMARAFPVSNQSVPLCPRDAAVRPG